MFTLPANTGKPLCKIAHVTDLHLTLPEELRGLRGMKQRLGDGIIGKYSEQSLTLSKLLIRELNRSDADLVLFTGDMTDSGIQGQFEALQHLLRKLEKPYLVTTGNHDFNSGISFKKFARYFEGRGFDEGRPYYSQSLSEGVHLVVYDAVNPGGEERVIPEAQFKWMEKEFVRHRDKLIILAGHHPVREPSGHIRYVANKNWAIHPKSQKAFKALLSDHPNTSLLLTGHYHTTRVDRLFHNRKVPLWQISSPSLVSQPMAFRMIDIRRSGKEGSAELSFHTLPQAHLYKRGLPSLADKLKPVLEIKAGRLEDQSLRLPLMMPAV